MFCVFDINIDICFMCVKNLDAVRQTSMSKSEKCGSVAEAVAIAVIKEHVAALIARNGAARSGRVTLLPPHPVVSRVGASPSSQGRPNHHCRRSLKDRQQSLKALVRAGRGSRIGSNTHPRSVVLSVVGGRPATKASSVRLSGTGGLTRGSNGTGSRCPTSSWR